MNAIPRLGPGEYIGASKVQEVRLAPRGTNLFGGTLTATTVAQAVGTQPSKEVLVQNDPSSTVNVLIGSSGVQPIVLIPGASIVVDVIDVSLLFVRSASATATVNWLATV